MTDKQNEEGLDICPFCGSKPQVGRGIYPSWFIYCTDKFKCGAETTTFPTESKARAAWNRRAEQIAVKVIRETEDENGVPLEHENYLCPGCKTLIYQHYKKCKWIEPIRWQNYCIDCGQRMDWSDFINPPLPGEEGT